MIALLQRVNSASVTINDGNNGEKIACIGRGLLVLLAVEKKDDDAVIDALAEKILKYRVFVDEADKMNLSVMDIKASVLMVPQFTLAADTQKGLRPSFSNAAEPEKGFTLFTQLVDIMRTKGETMVDDLSSNWLQTGRFGADMAVELINDGPVTFNLTV
jgi:D-tyrosyl-tRNA(Tyr) deacylase